MLSTIDFYATWALALGVVLSTGFSLLRSRNQPLHDRAQREGGSAFLPAVLMHRTMALCELPVLWLAARRISPDTISWASVGLGLFAGGCATGGYWGLAVWFLVLAGLCDLFDGAVARATGQVSLAGSVLDSILDRYIEAFLHFGLLIFFAHHVSIQILVMASLFGGMMVTYSTAKAEALQIKPPRVWMKRAERLVWLGGGLWLAAAAPSMGLNSSYFVIGAVGVVAVFANLAAILRLFALRQSCRETKR